MKLNILLKISDYREKQSCPLAIAIEPLHNETVEALMKRLFEGKKNNACVSWVEIRIEQDSYIGG